MLYKNTPVENHLKDLGLWVKREDLSCPKPGPPFSKTRGVYSHLENLPHDLIGVLDTRHSQAGHAVARACQILGKRCVNYYPEFKADVKAGSPPTIRPPQLRAQELGAELCPLKAGMSAVLWYQARRDIQSRGGYMMPNALKLPESVTETSLEVGEEDYDRVIIPISSGTIAAGVIRGFMSKGMSPTFVIHLGYHRSHDQVRKYLWEKSGYEKAKLLLIDENYAYADTARPGPTPPFPCNSFYDLKAFRWWMENQTGHRTLFWNIG